MKSVVTRRTLAIAASLILVVASAAAIWIGLAPGGALSRVIARHLPATGHWILQYDVSSAANIQPDGTSLIKAAAAGDIATARDLVARGADVNARNSDGVTPLSEALRLQRDAMVEFLLGHKVDVNTKAKNGQSPLIEACSLGRVDYTAALLAAGADVRARDQNGNDALTWACQIDGSLDLVSQLINRGADLNTITSPSGMTPLMYAAQSCSPSVVQLLLDRGARSDACDNEGLNALDWAALQNRRENIRTLVTRVNVNMRNRDGLTALMVISTSPGRNEAWQCLLECGSDIYAHAPDGLTARQIAERAGQWDKAECLRDLEVRSRAPTSK